MNEHHSLLLCDLVSLVDRMSNARADLLVRFVIVENFKKIIATLFSALNVFMLTLEWTKLRLAAYEHPALTNYTRRERIVHAIGQKRGRKKRENEFAEKSEKGAAGGCVAIGPCSTRTSAAIKASKASLK